MYSLVHLPSLVSAKNLLKNNHSNSGFTLPEMLVVIVLISILATIGISNWLAFVDTRRLNTAQNEVYYAMRQAQSQATKDKLTRQQANQFSYTKWCRAMGRSSSRSRTIHS